MNGPEAVRAVVREWTLKADNDLKAAAAMLRLGADCPADVACFHAQQCVEKYLKALLVHHTINFPKTHNIRTLTGLLPPRTRPQIDPALQDRLTEYATVTCYPGDYEPISLSEARKAAALARRVRAHVRRALQKESRHKHRLPS